MNFSTEWKYTTTRRVGKVIESSLYLCATFVRQVLLLTNHYNAMDLSYGAKNTMVFI